MVINRLVRKSAHDTDGKERLRPEGSSVFPPCKPGLSAAVVIEEMFRAAWCGGRASRRCSGDQTFGAAPHRDVAKIPAGGEKAMKLMISNNIVHRPILRRASGQNIQQK